MTTVFDIIAIKKAVKKDLESCLNEVKPFDIFIFADNWAADIANRYAILHGQAMFIVMSVINDYEQEK